MKTKLLILFSFLVLQSCFRKKEDPCGQQEYNYSKFSDTENSKVPYLKAEFDTIGFASDKGDTLVFVRQPRDSGWYCTSAYSNADCLPNYSCSEVYGAKYTCIKGQGNFEFKCGKTMFIDVKSSNPNFNARDYTDVIFITFNNFNLITFSYLIGNPKYNSYYVESITISGNTYNAIQKIYNKFVDTTIVSFYSSSYGLLKIEDQIKKTTYTIIRK